MRPRLPIRALGVLALCAASSGGASPPIQATFPTPDDAANALLTALASGNYDSFLAVAGRQMAGFWSSGSPERDDADREYFVETARREGLRADRESESRTVLYIGRMGPPFPAPLVKTEAGWQFDDAAGSRELTVRAMRRNETAVAEQCRRFREAEFEYLALASTGGAGFAGRIRSQPGQHDGLFWDAGNGDESPMGPLFAAAAFAERQAADGTRPLFGYYFKILAAQGPDAAGGALDYRTNGQLRKGFALIAWPDRYGVDGVHTFLINHFGDLYEKDLGDATGAIAGMTAVFNPDSSWSKVDERD